MGPTSTDEAENRAVVAALAGAAESLPSGVVAGTAATVFRADGLLNAAIPRLAGLVAGLRGALVLDKDKVAGIHDAYMRFDDEQARVFR